MNFKQAQERLIKNLKYKKAWEELEKANEWRIGDKIYKATINYKSKLSEEDDLKGLRDTGWVNLSAIGRKAALASSKKVGRDSNGRFIKMSHRRSVHLSSTLSGQRELLRNHENRIREIEKKLLNDQPKYINFGGAGGCNGTC